MSDADSGPAAKSEPDQARPEVSTGPRRLWAVVLVVMELMVVAVLVVGAFRMWGRAVVPIELSQLHGRTVTRMTGSWVAFSFAAATVAGLLLMDAARRILPTPRGCSRRDGEA
ncbi:hypothetical protein FHX42_004538 [Saccharopolyspora lacisalsi]|uniref:Uncharacterized protein n=1 Tax=Halosaccharopolyspora lacisalsi TaxID=1000566 RepID=A0A839E070_9PSEU|nr:hypothetical protein [Halosaccharopolyspora lacisalsi]MBA8827154.1 hypothetical protein [Halosaccharopolyspora lacisalsi]